LNRLYDLAAVKESVPDPRPGLQNVVNRKMSAAAIERVGRRVVGSDIDGGVGLRGRSPAGTSRE
jgi:hypothetical protein